ncbi:MAG: hypothetical protein AAGH65_09040, partial [Pseudomonadota bacterium]
MYRAICILMVILLGFAGPAWAQEEGASNHVAEPEQIRAQGESQFAAMVERLELSEAQRAALE